jgi:hypothetical protein
VAAATLDLPNHRGEVVALRHLQRRKFLQRLEPIEPELLADWQEVPVEQEGSAGRIQRASDILKAVF